MTDLLVLAQRISRLSPNVRAFAIEAAKQIQALQPAPVPVPIPATGGAGLYQLGGSLTGCSHLTDGTYATVIGDWDEAPLLAKVSGIGFAYTVVAGTPGADPAAFTVLDPANPQAYVDAVLAHRSRYGFKGVFLDNCVAEVPGLLTGLAQASGLLRAKGVPFAANVGNYIPGDPNSDNGTNWILWEQQVDPYLDYVMLENWMQFSGGGADVLGHLRTDANGGNKTLWQRCPAQPMHAKFMGCTYGPPAPGTTADAAAYGRAALLGSPGVKPHAVYCYSTPGRDPYGTWAAA